MDTHTPIEDAQPTKAKPEVTELTELENSHEDSHAATDGDSPKEDTKEPTTGGDKDVVDDLQADSNIDATIGHKTVNSTDHNGGPVDNSTQESVHENGDQLETNQTEISELRSFNTNKECDPTEIDLQQQCAIRRDDMCYPNITQPAQITKRSCEASNINKHEDKAESSTPETPSIKPPTQVVEPDSTLVQAIRRRTRDTDEDEPISEKYSNLGFALGSSPQTVSLSEYQRDKLTTSHIFKTLIMRIKTLEINQSIAAVYLADLTSSYAEAFSSMYRTFSRLEAANSDLLDLVQDTSKRSALKNKILAKELEELRVERMLMMSNISVLTNQIRVLAEGIDTLKSKQDTQQWIKDILIASTLGALVVGVLLRQSNGNTNNNSYRQKPRTSPVLKLSRSVGAGINVLTNPELEKQGGTPKTRRRRHSIGHSLSPFRTRKQLSFPTGTEESESDSNSDWEMDADDEISNKYFKNEEGGGSEGELTNNKDEKRGLARGLKERVFPYLMKKSASTSTMDTKYEPDLLRLNAALIEIDETH